MINKFSDNRSIATTISMPLCLYAELCEKARAEGISLSELVRRALYKEFSRKENKDSGE